MSRVPTGLGEYSTDELKAEILYREKGVGHKDPLINGKPLVDFIRESIRHDANYHGSFMPTDLQIALVISALRNHTITSYAISYDLSELHEPGKISSFYPEASSVGRYFRDASAITIDKESRRG